jgi:hypothetical protein
MTETVVSELRNNLNVDRWLMLTMAASSMAGARVGALRLTLTVGTTQPL